MKNENGEDLCKSCGEVLEDSPWDAEGMCFHCWEKKQINHPMEFFSEFFEPEIWRIVVFSSLHPILGKLQYGKEMMKVAWILFGIICACSLVLIVAGVLTT